MSEALSPAQAETLALLAQHPGMRLRHHPYGGLVWDWGRVAANARLISHEQVLALVSLRYVESSRDAEYDGYAITEAGCAALAAEALPV